MVIIQPISRQRETLDSTHSGVYVILVPFRLSENNLQNFGLRGKLQCRSRLDCLSFIFLIDYFLLVFYTNGGLRSVEGQFAPRLAEKEVELPANGILGPAVCRTETGSAV